MSSKGASKVVEITSQEQLDTLLRTVSVVVCDFWAEWCRPCLVMGPAFEQVAREFSVDGASVFAKIDNDTLRPIAEKYNVAVLPTFVLFRDGTEVDRVKGADLGKLKDLVMRVAQETGDAAGSRGIFTSSRDATGNDNGSGDGDGAAAAGSNADTWHGAALPRGYSDITSEVEVVRSELLNVDTTAGGGVRVLLSGNKPSGRAEAASGGEAPDWVESDTDEQLMLFLPFRSLVKLHTLQITSHPSGEAARPLEIRLYSNSPHNLGFDEAEDTQATQVIELKPTDWNAEATASISLRFVKFQKITSLVLFVVSAEDGAEKVRLDRIRLVGDAGETREMGKLEKFGDEQGE